MHTGGASIFHVPLISSARNLANDLSPCHALVTKSINGTVKFPSAFSDGTAVPAYVLGLSRLKIDLTKFDLRPEKGLMRASAPALVQIPRKSNPVKPSTCGFAKFATTG